MQRMTDLLAGRHTTTGDPLDAGAQLEVTDPDGGQVFIAPLARHHRVDHGDPATIWIRPVIGGEPSADGSGYTFNLNLARRRALAHTDAAIDASGNLVLRLRSGQTARIQPATGPQLQQLHRWDDFTLNVLTAGEERALEALDADSWHGRFA